MKTAFLLTMLLVAASGCSDRSHQAVMKKRFAEIDARYCAHLHWVNTNLEAAAYGRSLEFSNSIMSPKIDMTDIDAATNQIERLIHEKIVEAFYENAYSELLGRLQRTEATNELLAAKLALFFTNTFPPSEGERSATFDEEALSETLRRDRGDQLVMAELDHIQAMMEAETNQSAPPPVDPVKQHKQEVLEEYARQGAIKREQILAQRRRDVIRKSGVQFTGTVFQITSGGILARFIPFGELVFIVDYDTKGIVDDSPISQLPIWPIGTYTYDTAGNSTKTVPRYTASFQKAVSWTESK